MNDFLESDIFFSFGEKEWSVMKYDDNLAHLKVEKVLKPTKAVDFLGIHKDSRLFFIEVKNYRGHTMDQSTQEVLSAGGEELMRRIAVKVRDTIATATGSARFSTNDQDFFTEVNRLMLDNGKKLVIVACIELDIANEKEYKAKLGIWQQKLKQKLSWLNAARVSINSVDNIPAVVPDLRVSFV